MTTRAHLAEIKVHGEVELTALVVFLQTFHVHTEIQGWNVDQTCLLVVAHRHPVFSA